MSQNPSAAQAPERRRRTGETANDRRLSVLLVDDQQEVREMYAQYLAFAGVGVTTAQDGGEALDIARAYPPDVIVMDLAMPGTDGWDFLKEARSDAQVKQIPVVVVTAYGGSDTADAALEAGASAFVDKPVIPSDLLSLVRRTATKGRIRRGH
jgi:two-component system, cell cycle response regulator DivK